ncbi:glycosyltransferase family 2 protein [Mesotoga sp. UBA5825]|uniref:glycosyltransferase family 2 protein n=1 Tax=Mesotoga sp. UBA5825 TaxID=1946858 RepID=UPI000A63CF44|nr:glycosyltransferase [Mesotoga sp. UBA5825]
MNEERIPGLVSIIIPTYNNQETVGETLKSCIEQSYDDIELIVVNDGSSDQTENVIQSFRDARIRYCSTKNYGVSHARNLGLEISRGEFIQFLDADDLISRSKLDAQTRFLRNNEYVDLVYCFTEYFREDKRQVIYVNNYVFEGDVAHRMMRGNFLPIHAPLIRWCDLTFDEQLGNLEDWDYWIRFALSGKKFACIPEVLCSVRIRDKSRSSDYQTVLKYYLPVVDKYSHICDYEKDISYVKFVRLAELGSKRSLHYLKKLHKNYPKGTVRDFFLMIYLWTKCYLKRLMWFLGIKKSW